MGQPYGWRSPNSSRDTCRFASVGGLSFRRVTAVSRFSRTRASSFSANAGCAITSDQIASAASKLRVIVDRVTTDASQLDEGTTTRSALQIAEQIGDLGAALTTSSSWDASVVTLSTITRSFDAALAIWADVIAHPAFAEKELARVRENLLTAVTRRKDSPPRWRTCWCHDCCSASATLT